MDTDDFEKAIKIDPDTFETLQKIAAIDQGHVALALEAMGGTEEEFREFMEEAGLVNDSEAKEVLRLIKNRNAIEIMPSRQNIVSLVRDGTGVKWGKGKQFQAEQQYVRTPLITEEWIQQLESLLEKADLDGAVAYIANLRPEEFQQSMAHDLEAKRALRARCLACEVYDYAGRTSEANLCLSGMRDQLYEDLQAALRPRAEVWKSKDALEYLKQECLACLHLGMVAHYRSHEYQEAFKLFERAEAVLSRINTNAPPIRSFGTLARTYYCLGLAEREQHNFDEARRNFSKAVECAWTRILEKQQKGRSVSFLKYLIGRALGLGMAWIAYTRASMPEANAHIVAARLILQETVGVKYLRDYVEVVHACAQRSCAGQISEILTAIATMENIYYSLGGNSIVADRNAPGHFVYAQRTACELATAHIYAARVYGRDSQQAREAANGHLEKADNYVMLVQGSLDQSDPEYKDTRTRCNLLIAKSRIYREKEDYPRALDYAERAADIAEDNPFSRITCWTNLGEAYYHVGQIKDALEQFRKARNDSHAQTNPKVLAVCDLQTALCHIELNQVNIAQEIVARWKSQGSLGLANAFVQHLLKKIDGHFSEAAFFIPADAPVLNEEEWIAKAQKWLADTALKRANGDRKKAAKLIGRDKKTLEKYMNLADSEAGDTHDPK